MDKENLKNQALIEEFRQSWSHLRHIENQRWKIFMVFGSLCGVCVSGISIAKTLGGEQIPFPVIFASALFFQVFASIILLILLKWRYEFCTYVEDIQRKRKRFEFTQIESVFVGKPVPGIFKSDSVHWAVILFFWIVVIATVTLPIALMWGSNAVLILLPDIAIFIFFGIIPVILFNIINIFIKNLRKKFFKKYERVTPVIICILILLSPFLVLYLYLYCGRSIVILILLIQFLLLAFLAGVFFYRWLDYKKKIEGEECYEK